MQKEKFDRGGMGYGPGMYQILINPMRNKKSNVFFLLTLLFVMNSIGSFEEVIKTIAVTFEFSCFFIIIEIEAYVQFIRRLQMKILMVFLISIQIIL